VERFIGQLVVDRLEQVAERAASAQDNGNEGLDR
jgi:hypothetical protein